ncbi:hypothetical protein AB1K70_19170 [Bremerella sp. JC770]|uniref:hypothetical protein n=1 Tax=Bremerella sp. JC770 TaxID=3232137 RepID=UPI0034590D31
MSPDDAADAKNRLQELSIRARNEQCSKRQKDLRAELRKHVTDVVNRQTFEVDTLGQDWERLRELVELKEFVRLFSVVAGQANPEPLQRLVDSAMK